eukprot:433944-Alexandrium_andersonii.AAC.1
MEGRSEGRLHTSCWWLGAPRGPLPTSAQVSLADGSLAERCGGGTSRASASRLPQGTQALMYEVAAGDEPVEGLLD